MKRLIMLAVLAGASSHSLSARADWGNPQAQPQVPSPPSTPQAPAYPGYAIPNPILPGQGFQPPTTPAPGTPAPGMTVVVNGPANCQGGACGGGNCTKPKNFLTKMKDWICYCPKAGDALPLLKVQPYTGPWVGTFYCTPTPGSPNCGNSGNCNGGCSGPCSTPKAPRSSNSCPGSCGTGGMPVAPQGYTNRGCQGPSMTAVIPAREQPIAAEPNESSNIYLPVPREREAVEPSSLPRTNPGTVEIPEVGNAPQSRLIIPSVPVENKGQVVTASQVSSTLQIEQSDVVPVEFRAVRIAAYFPRVEPEKKFIGAMMIGKQIMTPLESLSRP